MKINPCDRPVTVRLLFTAVNEIQYVINIIIIIIFTLNDWFAKNFTKKLEPLFNARASIQIFKFKMF